MTFSRALVVACVIDISIWSIAQMLRIEDAIEEAKHEIIAAIREKK